MNVFGDKRFSYLVAALIVVVIAVVIWQRSKTEVSGSPAATSTPAAPATTTPASPTPEAPAKQ